MWMYLGLFAALFLGLHSLCKKHAVQGNELFPVLFGTISSGFLLLLPLYLGSVLYEDYMVKTQFYIATILWKTHGFIFIKSMIMASSWILAYQVLKHLPLTIVTPIRSAGPFFTFIGAILIYQENPNFLQWIGFFLIILSVILYSKMGNEKVLNSRKINGYSLLLALPF